MTQLILAAPALWDRMSRFGVGKASRLCWFSLLFQAGIGSLPALMTRGMPFCQPDPGDCGEADTMLFP